MSPAAGDARETGDPGDTPPSLSIVVVSLAGGDATRRLLEALAKSAAECEIIATGSPEGEPVPGVVWLSAPEETSVPARRSLGAERAKGDVVAFLEDTVAVGPDWEQAVRRLHAAHPEALAIGGTLALDSALLAPAAQALALLDAGRFVTSDATSETTGALPGCNLSFKRSALEALGALRGEPLREAEAIPQLASRPGAVRLESDMAARFVASDTRGQHALSRFQHGRLYAGHRESSWGERCLRALLTPVLPFVLIGRCWRVAGRSAVRPLAPVMATAMWFASAWSLGEAAGYLFGAGEAERHWR